MELNTLRIVTSPYGSGELGDICFDYNGDIEICTKNGWKKFINQDNLQIQLGRYKHTHSSTDIIDHYTNIPLNKIIETLVHILISRGIINNIDEFKEILEAKKIAEQLANLEETN